MALEEVADADPDRLVHVQPIDLVRREEARLA
jgi:hypothetical protein